MDSQPIPYLECPICGHHLSMATSLNGLGASVVPGSLALCIACSGVLTFTADLHLRRLNVLELAQMQTDDPDMWDLIVRSKRVMAEERGKP